MHDGIHTISSGNRPFQNTTFREFPNLILHFPAIAERKSDSSTQYQNVKFAFSLNGSVRIRTWNCASALQSHFQFDRLVQLQVLSLLSAKQPISNRNFSLYVGELMVPSAKKCSELVYLTLYGSGFIYFSLLLN